LPTIELETLELVSVKAKALFVGEGQYFVHFLQFNVRGWL
jgi:hypothetical protein